MKIKAIENVKILVIGDIMLDRYVCGTVDKISAEAPVPIVNVTKEYSVLGGCGNVINNIASFGANIRCIARVGNDLAGKYIMDTLNALDVESNFIIDDESPTIQKERIVAYDRQVQMIRIDRENITPVPDTVSDQLIHQLSREIDIIVISDYAKGMITKNVMSYIRGSRVKVIVDPKPSNMHLYNDVYMITPNQTEYEQMCLSSRSHFGNCKYILNTKGKRGMILYDQTSNKSTKIDSTPVDVYNVSGAGDTVVAAMSVCLAAGIEPITSARIANECARYVVTQPGTSTVPKHLFDEIITQKVLLDDNIK